MAAHSSNATRPNTTCLPFNPGPKFKALLERYGQVDRYLFRLSDKYSRASTDRTWVKSRDARLLRPSSNSDIFARYSYSDSAEALRRHLFNEVVPHIEENFVSWSSSLLSLLQHACCMMRQKGVYSPTDTFICVVDTTRLPDCVFVSDLFLISAFSPYEVSTAGPSTSRRTLRYLQSLQQSPIGHPEYSGSYCFGQYLSQGALHVDGRCSMVPLADIIDAGLYALRPELSVPTLRSEIAMVSIIKLRETFYDASPFFPAEAFEIESALRVGDKYGPSWKLPIALAFLALRPRPAWDDGIIKAFRQFHGHVTVQLSPSNTKLVSPDTLPEVKEFDTQRRCVCEDVLLQAALRHCVMANNALKTALQRVAQTKSVRIEDLPRIEDSSHYNALDAVTQSVENLRKELSKIMERESSDSDDDDDSQN